MIIVPQSRRNFYIAFEGPIAAGKTTLAKLFAAQVDADVLLEDYEGNAFLEDYYSDPTRWALAMQLSFLATRHQQLFKVPRQCQRPLVADHTYAKDAIFAHALLAGRELALYEALRRTLSGQARPPGIIVYLDAPNETLLERIHLRGRPYEATIDGPYLDRIRAAYERELPRGGHSTIVPIDTTTIDITSPESISKVSIRILNATGETLDNQAD